MAIQEIRVEYKQGIGVPGLEKVRTTTVYRPEGVTEEGAQKLADTRILGTNATSRAN